MAMQAFGVIHGRRYQTILLVVVVFAVSIGTLFLYGDAYNFVARSRPEEPTCSDDERDMALVLPRMWRNSTHNITDTAFTTPLDHTYRIVNDAHRWQNIGKKLLIVDIDSRLDITEGGMLNTTSPTEKTMMSRTGGYLNHMLYALIHGYDYRLVRPPEYEDRVGAWTKLPVMREALKNYDMVMFLDADAIFENLQLPFEWLLSHWNITTNTLVALPQDVHQSSNYDDKGMVFWNAGVIFAQQSERTQELFRRWENCPTDDEFEHCSQWKMVWAAEQAAFNNYIRYEYDMTEDLRMIPCNEANGNTGYDNPECSGDMISHWWHWKEYAVTKLYTNIDQCTVQDLHQYFLRNQDKYFLDASNMTYPLGHLGF